jgi:hypothetical protein
MSTEKRTKLLPWIAVLAVAGLMAFIAIPVLAAPSGTKYYLFAVSPSGTANPVNTGTTQNFTVSVTNTSPKQSSSNISSVSILVPTQFTINGTPTITSASTNGDNSSAVVAVNGPNSVGCTAGTGQKVSICSIAPVKSQKKVVVSIATTVGTAGLACGQSVASDPWVVKANTGSQLNGNDFDPDPTQASPITTTIQHVCNASIAGQIWRDHNQNGAKDPTFESAQTGWTINAYDGTTGDPAGTVTYPSAGHYKVSNLEAGHAYTVCETAPAEDPAFPYRGWFQESPTDPDFPSGVASTTTCSASGTESTGYSVTPPTTSPDVTGVDFFNARAIEVTTCGTTYSVGGGNTGDPSGSVTMPAECKTGTYIFESWVNPDGTQETDFYPVHITGGTGSTQVTQSITWPLSNKGQATLQYDDDPSNPPGFQPVLFCDVDSQGNFTGMPVDEQPGATTCLMHTDETPTSGGVIRHDTIITSVDGKLRTSY